VTDKKQIAKTVSATCPDERSDLLERLSARLVELLEALCSNEAEAWMQQLSGVAEERGWVDSAHNLRRPAWVFARDLLADNPTAFERLPLVGFELSRPDDIEELCTFEDMIV